MNIWAIPRLAMQPINPRIQQMLTRSDEMDDRQSMEPITTDFLLKMASILPGRIDNVASGKAQTTQ